jgi:hypothetical protein
MAGTNDVLNNVRDFVSLRAAMPHSPPVLTNIRGLAFRRPAPTFRAMPSLPPAYLSQKLTQPLPTKGGAVLRTIGEAANYVLALPTERAEHCNRWRHAARLLLDQADVAEVSRQVHLALHARHSARVAKTATVNLTEVVAEVD